MPWEEIIDKPTGKPTGFYVWHGPWTEEVHKLFDAAIRPPVLLVRGDRAGREVPRAGPTERPAQDEPHPSLTEDDKEASEPPLVVEDMISETSMRDDEGTPIQDQPGFLGLVWDGEFAPEAGLWVLADFDWQTYSELVEELGETRRLLLRGLLKPIEIGVVPYADLSDVLDQLPSVDAIPDAGPDDSPAAGSGSILFLAEGASVDQVEREAQALRDALDADLFSLGGSSDEWEAESQ